MSGDTEELFYHRLERRETYSRAEGVKSPKYSDYRQEIEEDCKNRCVYCDVTVQEHAYEGMQLDHFRPEKHFPTLANDPRNLVLACPKCNRFKWHYWPCERDTGAPSHDDHVGFIEPFSERYGDYFSVQSNGTLEGKKPPATYMIELLRLNRNARIQVRRRRILNDEINNLVKLFSNRIQMLVKSFDNGEIPAPATLKEIQKLLSAVEDLRTLLD